MPEYATFERPRAVLPACCGWARARARRVHRAHRCLGSSFVRRIGDGSFAWLTELSKADVFTVYIPTSPDSDFGTNPVLFDAKVAGRSRKLVGAGQSTSRSSSLWLHHRQLPRRKRRQSVDVYQGRSLRVLRLHHRERPRVRRVGFEARRSRPPGGEPPHRQALTRRLRAARPCRPPARSHLRQSPSCRAGSKAEPRTTDLGADWPKIPLQHSETGAPKKRTSPFESRAPSAKVVPSGGSTATSCNLPPRVTPKSAGAARKRAASSPRWQKEDRALLHGSQRIPRLRFGLSTVASP
jgi:hypothetical protein